jgi:hypothetical protein
MGGFEKVALKKAADYAALEFRKTIVFIKGSERQKSNLMCSTASLQPINRRDLSPGL